MYVLALFESQDGMGMIDKKAMLIIVTLAVVAIVILAMALVVPSMSGPSSSSFSGLFDKMVEKNSGEKNLALPNATYKAGDKIVVTDKIIAMRSHTYSTTLYFLYQGTKWVSETEGTSFHVLTEGGYISVYGAMFSISIGTDLSVAFDIGDSITIQTTAEASDGAVVLGDSWALVNV